MEPDHIFQDASIIYFQKLAFIKGISRKNDIFYYLLEMKSMKSSAFFYLLVHFHFCFAYYLQSKRVLQGTINLKVMFLYNDVP